MEGSQRSEATPRLPVELEVDCATEDMSEPITLTTKDLGEGGVFLKTEFPLDPGNRFGCRFHIGGEPLLAEGEVAWVRTGPPESQPPPGMGVRFVALDPDDSQRLQQFVGGLESEDGDADGELPRVSFRLHGVGSPVPGEFRSMSDNGLAAVAELPFLQVGSTVQVSIDQPGSEGLKAGRIAWLALERDEDVEEGQSPKIRLGIHFDDSLEVTPAADASWSLSKPEPVPLTVRKAEPEALAAGMDEPMSEPSYKTPWQADLTPRPRTNRNPRTRRRVRGRNTVGKQIVGLALQSIRERAAQNPKVAMGVVAGAAVLMLTLFTALAFSGSEPSINAKPKKAPAANVAPVVDPEPALAPAPGPAPVAQPGAQAPTVAGAPPLPASRPGGPNPLVSGPGVGADPGKVLAKGAGNDLLSDPGQPAPAKKLARKVHHYTLGNKLVVKLPLLSKPGRVKHYLLANPDGAVIDVAGAAPALKPGRYKVGDGRVRMVKVLNRGKAARFIVYYGKKTKKPKIRIMAGSDEVKLVLTAPRVGKASWVAKRGRKKANKGKRARRRPGLATRRRARNPRGKMRRRVRSRRVRKPMKRRRIRRRVAPVADASD